MSEITIHAIISGKVQGVYYRDSTRQQAQALYIKGWVKNLPDGRVELMASGQSEAISLFTAWLWQGSSASKVNAVDWNTVAYTAFEDFTVKHD